MAGKNKTITIVIPAYNEQDNVLPLFRRLFKVFKKLPYDVDFLFVNDSSTDDTILKLNTLVSKNPEVHYIDLARNSGKEIATTAGLHHAKGDAVIIIDSDLQHPPEMIPEFIEKWQNGAQVVTGMRRIYKRDQLVKRIGSWFFYALFNKISDVKILQNATDFRLLDRQVVDEYKRFTEHNRIVRGLIDWLGFEQDYVKFDVAERHSGEANYSVIKLIRLATNSFVSLSLVPLRITGYFGIFITLSSGLLGVYIFFDRFVFNNPFNFNFSGTAMLAVLILFLIGIVLMSLGLIALYIAHIHTEVVNRPLYVIRRQR